jgi:hypothetical protein
LNIFANPNQNKCTKFSSINVGLSSGNVPNGSFVGVEPNSYAIPSGYGYCWLSGNQQKWPNGATKPESKGEGDVVGCGLLLSSGNEVSIFFTGNGLLIG